MQAAGGEGSSGGLRRKWLLGALTPTAGGSFLPASGCAVQGCHAAMSELRSVATSLTYRREGRSRSTVPGPAPAAPPPANLRVPQPQVCAQQVCPAARLPAQLTFRPLPLAPTPDPNGPAATLVPTEPCQSRSWCPASTRAISAHLLVSFVSSSPFPYCQNWL